MILLLPGDGIDSTHRVTFLFVQMKSLLTKQPKCRHEKRMKSGPLTSHHGTIDCDEARGHKHADEEIDQGGGGPGGCRGTQHRVNDVVYLRVNTINKINNNICCQMSDVGVLGVERQKGTFTRGPRRSTGPFRRNPPVHGLGSGHDQRPHLDLVQLGRDQRGLRDVEKHGVLWNVLERTLLEVKDSHGQLVG